MSERICSVDLCESQARARGWCHKHYKRWQVTGTTDDPPSRINYCSIDGCEDRAHGQGYCGRHYANLRRYGDPLSVTDCTPMDRLERVGWDVTDGECWEWRGYRGNRGYGVLTIDYRHHFAHRLMLSLHSPPPSDEFFALHACDNPPCVNPDHLRWGTHEDNMSDMTSRGRHQSYMTNYWRGMCRKGLHDVTGAGALYVDTAGQWRCSACFEANREGRNRRRRKKSA